LAMGQDQALDGTLSNAREIERGPNGHPVARVLDAGEQNCATLVMSVRDEIAILQPGQILAVVAYDPSAQLDLRAWCRMTGHRFLGQDNHNNYSNIYLEKKGASLGEHADQRKLR
jgi:tRNA 2-thiouridine synthesizing protein A